MSWLREWPLLGDAAGIDFRSPWLLWLVPLVVLLLVAVARSRLATLRFSALELIPTTHPTWRTRCAFFPDLLVALAGALFVIAIAGPRTSDARSKIHREGIAIMMAVDVSSSMRALDLSDEDGEKTRLEAVKAVFEDFVLGDGELRGRPDDAIGLVSFAGFADTRSPLTLDQPSLLAIVDELEIVQERSEDGTAIGEGLGLAVERLKRSKAASKIVILLTDGVNNRGEETPLGAAQLAEAEGLRVYAIGAGTTGLAHVRAADPFTGQMVRRQIPVEIDEETLRAIADKTGGRYFRATDADALRQVYLEIDRLERSEISEERYRRYHEHFALVTALAILLAMLGWMLRATVLRRIPG